MKGIALCLVAVTAAFNSALAQDKGVDRNGLAQEMNSMTSTEWSPGVPFGNKLAALPGSSGFEILRDNWNKGASVQAREQMFKGFVFNDHPDTLKVLNLGATDASVEMQKWSFSYLKQIAFIDFNEVYSSYHDWFAKYGDRKLDDVRNENFDLLIREVEASKGADRERQYRKVQQMLLGRQLVHSARALEIIKDVFTSANPSRDGARAAGELFKVVDPDEGFMREVVLPALHSPSVDLRFAASQAVAKCKFNWVNDSIAAMVKASFDTPNGLRENGFMIGMAVGERNDPKNIPLLIGAIAADNTYDSVYGLGYFGLSKLTGVPYDKTHDGQWWLTWWSNNKTRFPEGVRNLPIPTFGRPPVK